MSTETTTPAPVAETNVTPVSLPPKSTTTAPVVEAPAAAAVAAELAVVSAPAPTPTVAPEAITSAATKTIEIPAAAAVIAVPALAVPAPVPAPLLKPIGATVPVEKATMPVLVSSAPIPPAVTKSKSKKKKNQPTVTMATAVTAQAGGPGTAGENTGRWTAEEHRLFLQGLEQHGKGWKKIASLIKSRTVVQIRTHAQKYFQKLAKARQNGEEGEISMEGRGGPSSVTSGGIPGSGTPTGKRRRQTTGTKRKAITSVVVSATREGKKVAAAQSAAGVPCPVPPLPAVAPALAPFVVPPAAHPNTTVPAAVSSLGSMISGPALEDSLFRFLTPAPVHNEGVQLNEVARQAGANPITLPSDNPAAPAHSSGGEVSPTGVADSAIFPTWTDAKDMPSWYAKGADIDCLLDVADTLDWLTDTGDLHETYEPPAQPAQPLTSQVPTSIEDTDDLPILKAPSVTTLAVDALTGDHSVDDVVPPLPSLFEEPASKKLKMSSTNLTGSESIDHLDVFDTPMEEHAFVSALLENGGESSVSLAGFGEAQ